MFVALKLRGAGLRAALAEKCTHCRPDAAVVLIRPAVQVIPPTISFDEPVLEEAKSGTDVLEARLQLVALEVSQAYSRMGGPLWAFSARSPLPRYASCSPTSSSPLNRR